jgi:hypothetical protein
MDNNLQKTVHDLSVSLAQSADQAIRNALDKLTPSEQEELGTNNGDFYPARLVKIVMCAVVTSELVEREFASESVLKDIKKVRRLIKNRY